MEKAVQGVVRLFSCYKCGCHVALHDDIVSKHFQSGNGRAYLFSQATNFKLGPRENRQLITGLHVVCDVFCSDCGENLGWKYEQAFEPTQKYKEGKVVLEKYKILMDIL
ncbi:unnamed protein product [Rhodiola kirilowii]